MSVKPKLAHIGVVALLGGVLLLATTNGIPALAAGIALLYLSGIAFVASVFRRIRETERRWSTRPSSVLGLGLYRRQAERRRGPEEGLV